MQIKKIFVFIFLLISYIANVTVYGASKEITWNQQIWVEITADVPTGFDRNIMVNFISDDEINVVFNLTSENGYKVNSQVPVGLYTLDFISIYGNNIFSENNFSWDAEEQVQFDDTNGRYSIQIFKPTKKRIKTPVVREGENLSKEKNEIHKITFMQPLTGFILIGLIAVYCRTKWRNRDA